MGYLLIFLMIIAPIVLLVLLIAIFANSLKVLKLILVFLAVLLLIFGGNAIRVSILRANDMRNMQARIPQTIEIFEQSREQFDTIANSEFVVNRAEVRRQEDVWVIWYRFRTVPLESEVTIEWLSNEEREALIYLVSSEELEYNFTRIGDWHRAGGIWAQLFYQGDAVLSISYTKPYEMPNRGAPANSVDLGDGYTLWIYRPLISAYGYRDVRVFTIAAIFILIATTTIKLNCVFDKEKQKAKVGQTPEAS